MRSVIYCLCLQFVLLPVPKLLYLIGFAPKPSVPATSMLKKGISAQVQYNGVVLPFIYVSF